MARAIAAADGIDASKEPLDGSVRGRLGYAWDRALIYATGGVAFGDFNNSDVLGDSVWNARVGWTAGGRHRIRARQQLVDARRISLHGLRPLLISRVT